MGDQTLAGPAESTTADALGPQRASFDVPRGVGYFNTSGMAPMLHAVRMAGEEALRRRAEPWTIKAEAWFHDVDRLRSLFGALVGGDPDGVAMVPATSYGFAVAAGNLPIEAGRLILVLAEEYPSGIYTWRRRAAETGAEIRTVTREPGQTWTEAVLAGLDDRVAIVSVPNVHWTDGALVDLAAVAAATRAASARLVVDASQSLGAMPLDVSVLRPDFLVCVGYKWLLGPVGRGYLWVAPEHRDGRPLEENWISRAGSEDFSGLVDYRDEYQPGARRYDQGERAQFELTPMSAAALEWMLVRGVHRISAGLARITADLARRVADRGLDVQAPEPRGPHILGLRLPDRVRDRILPALAEANCYAALRGSSLRVSPHLHVLPEDAERLVDALTAVLAE
jgi:selenocysteine lyase/cysteine desulfurase